jgi:hypothetical protein
MDDNDSRENEEICQLQLAIGEELRSLDRIW